VNEALLNLSALSCERDQRVLFQDLNLEIRPGDAVELTGPNGSGKTTLLRCLAGLSPGYQGGIQIGDFIYLGHASGLSGLLSVRENQRWYASLGGKKVGDEDLDAALSRVGLAGYQDIACAQLSAGEKRRVNLSRLLFSDAALWLLDEPLTALDKEGVTLVRELINAHCQSRGAALYATHQSLALDLAQALDLGDFSSGNRVKASDSQALNPGNTGLNADV
jgi:heme exporter protein A